MLRSSRPAGGAARRSFSGTGARGTSGAEKHFRREKWGTEAAAGRGREDPERTPGPSGGALAAMPFLHGFRRIIFEYQPLVDAILDSLGVQDPEQQEPLDRCCVHPLGWPLPASLVGGSGGTLPPAYGGTPEPEAGLEGGP